MKLSKFPVISPSGAEYRVTIREKIVVQTPEYDTDGLLVHLYVRRESGPLRRFFPWRRVWRESYAHYGGPFRGITEETVRRYEARPLDDPAQQFREWDGVIKREEDDER